MSQKSPEELIEEVAANCVGGGAVAGIGVGPQGEPGVARAQQRARAVLLSRMMKRFRDAAPKS